MYLCENSHSQPNFLLHLVSEENSISAITSNKDYLMRALSLQNPRFISKSIHAASQEVVHTAAMALQTRLFFSNPMAIFCSTMAFPGGLPLRVAKILEPLRLVHHESFSLKYK